MPLHDSMTWALLQGVLGTRIHRLTGENNTFSMEGLKECFLEEMLYYLDAGSVCFGSRVNTRIEDPGCRTVWRAGSCTKGSVGRMQNVK